MYFIFHTFVLIVAFDSTNTPKIGSVVGQKAEPICTSNIGHKMLLKMGWKTGDSLGLSSEKGVVSAIDVVIRGKRSGLGTM